jgi:hypothetical protein
MKRCLNSRGRGVNDFAIKSWTLGLAAAAIGVGQVGLSVATMIVAFQSIGPVLKTGDLVAYKSIGHPGGKCRSDSLGGFRSSSPSLSSSAWLQGSVSFPASSPTRFCPDSPRRCSCERSWRPLLDLDLAFHHESVTSLLPFMVLLYAAMERAVEARPTACMLAYRKSGLAGSSARCLTAVRCAFAHFSGPPVYASANTSLLRHLLIERRPIRPDFVGHLRVVCNPPNQTETGSLCASEPSMPATHYPEFAALALFVRWELAADHGFVEKGR